MSTTAPTTLEQLSPGARVHGVFPDGAVEVIQVSWHGSAAVTLTYRRPDGRPDHQILHRDDEARLRIELPRPPERPPIEDTIGLMAQRIAAQFHPERIVLFGSRARGDAHADSDVDLLVVFDEVESQHDLGVEIRRAVADLRVAKDIVVRSSEEVQRRGHLVGTVLKPALEEGRVLYQRS